MKKVTFGPVMDLSGVPMPGDNSNKTVANLLVTMSAKEGNVLQRYELAKKIYAAGDKEIEIEDSEAGLIKEALSDGRATVMLAAPILAQIS